MSAVQASFLPEISPVIEPATPLMAQYLALKAQHQECLLFFRLGDFYELFFEDAIKASRTLDIALTRRGQHQGQDIPMCGVPAHAYETYVAKLIRAGYRVAVCEQRETPHEAKKRGAKSIVTRDVVRIITPGTLTEDSLLDARAANYLACLTSIGDEIGLSWCDIVSGHVYSQSVAEREIGSALARLGASEILIMQRLYDKVELQEVWAPWRSCLVPQPNGRFDSDNAKRRLLAFYHIADSGVLGDFSRAELTALGALIDYVALTQKTDLKHFGRPQKTGATQVTIDAATRRNLELTRTLSGEKSGSLLEAIDRTQTGAGARLLSARLSAPLTDVAAIQARLEGVAFFVGDPSSRGRLRTSLSCVPDLERALARLSLERAGPRDLASVCNALKQAEIIKQTLAKLTGAPKEIRDEGQNLGNHTDLIACLEASLIQELPMLAREGNFIARGYNSELDELITLRDDGRRLIAGLQAQYAAQVGLASLKIKYNQVIGYHIEVGPSQAEKLLAFKDTFIHRQSLTTSARFTTVELSEMERKITEAADKAVALELEIFAVLVQKILKDLASLRKVASALASLDVTTALAELAVEEKYACPIVDGSLEFSIKGGRHPVVEQALRKNGGSVCFIPNDCDLAPHQHLWLLTGPNMAGKSTFLRQSALIALLAQTGSFVPASFAHIGVIDRLFSRVGAADDLAAGRSTFMVEMVETATILTQAGERSLVILDEIGRGTSTYDGLSIAWAVLEHLSEVNKCRALFATHYHELTGLAKKLPTLRKATMRIKEWENKVIFLHEVIEGVADRSYGIHVAQMAGLPPAAIARAEQVLHTLESECTEKASLSDALATFDMSLASKQTVKRNSALEDLVAAVDPDALTPKEALDMLYKIKASFTQKDA